MMGCMDRYIPTASSASHMGTVLTFVSSTRVGKTSTSSTKLEDVLPPSVVPGTLIISGTWLAYYKKSLFYLNQCRLLHETSDGTVYLLTLSALYIDY